MLVTATIGLLIAAGGAGLRWLGSPPSCSRLCWPDQMSGRTPRSPGLIRWAGVLKGHLLSNINKMPSLRFLCDLPAAVTLRGRQGGETRMRILRQLFSASHPWRGVPPRTCFYTTQLPKRARKAMGAVSASVRRRYAPAQRTSRSVDFFGMPTIPPARLALSWGRWAGSFLDSAQAYGGVGKLSHADRLKPVAWY
jgi:hypothetical protein